MARSPKRESLASNLALLMLLVVTVTVTAVSAAALTGVFDLASRQAGARQAAYEQAITGELRVRLDGAAGVLERGSSVLADASGPELNRTALAAQYDAGVEYVDRLVIADADGVVLSGYPAFQAPRDVSNTPYLDAADSDGVFVFVPEEGGNLWISRRVNSAAGELVVLVRVRTAFLEQLVDEFSDSTEGRIALISDAQGGLVVVARSDDDLREGTLVFEAADETGSGSITGRTGSAVLLSGRYAELEGYPGIAWRVAVLEPRMLTAAATWRALSPAAVALILTSALAVIASFAFARRIVAPIGDFELRAGEAVAGAYVRQISSDRADELGRVADAFNAIALRLNSLHDLAQLLASSSSVDQVLDGILSAMGHMVGTASVSVFLLDETGEQLVLARSRGLNLPPDLAVPLDGGGWLTAAIQAGGPVSFAGDVDSGHSLFPGGSDLYYGTGLAAPLMVGLDPLGVIVVVESERREFTQAEVEMVRTFSAQAAVAVHNSRLFEFESASRKEAEALRDVAERLATPRELEASFLSVMDVACDLFDASHATIAFVDRATYGLAPAQDALSERVMLRAWEDAWERGDGDTVLRVLRGDGDDTDRMLDSLDAEEALVLTVTRSGEPGAIVMLVPEEPDRPIGGRLRARAEALCNELALALDNAFHYAQARSRAVNLETVFRISQAVSSSLQIKVVLNRVLDVVQKIFTADAVALMEYDEARQLVSTVMARGLISSEILHYECQPGEGVVGHVFSVGEPVKLDDISDTTDGLAAAGFEQGLMSMLSVPLLARGRSLGVLTVFSVQPAAFSEEDMGLLHTFASQAALAIDTAALYEKEHHVASVLQSSILPQVLPEFDEIQAASVYLPAGQEAEIGGDYFDLFRRADGVIAFAIGDVCGKGVEAATKTSMLKYSVRAFLTAGFGPAETLREVNRMIAESGQTSDIVTLWVGALDVEEGTLRFANGGHPPALILRQETGEIERLETTGPLLGALDSAAYDEITTTIAEGDTVMLYTDGVTEARRGNKFFGEGRVRRALSGGGEPAVVVDRLLSSLDTFAPGNLRDDAAVLAVRFKSGRSSNQET